MNHVAFELLILLAGIWLVAVTLRPLGLPTVMGDSLYICGTARAIDRFFDHYPASRFGGG